MGYVLDRNHEDGNKLGGEVRSESFYVYPLTVPGEEATLATRVYSYAGGEYGDSTVEFLLSDIPELRKLLDDVEEHAK